MENMRRDENSRNVIESFLDADDSSVTGVEYDLYKQACEDLTYDVGVLSDKQIDDIVESLNEESEILAYFPPGYRCCPAALPFDNFGRPLSDDQIVDGEHIHILLINNITGETLLGFTGDKSWVFNALPEEIKKLAFVIPQYTAENRESFIELLKGSLKNLQSTLTPPSPAS